MGKWVLIATAAGMLLAGAPVAAAATSVQRPQVTWVRGDGSYTKASRSANEHTITTIVIHATDGGTLGGNVWWLSGGHSHASAHYVISRDGSIVQLVHLSDVAWHSGNSNVNRHSIGIEHVGETYDPNGFTAEAYHSSARLVAWLVRRYDIPVDRSHIIGHSQVPDPNDPALLGGADHHTDPGPFWHWAYYLSLVRHYAFPERYALHVDTTTIDRDQSLRGIVPWRVRVKGPAARRVDFLVDGEIVWSDSRKPFTFARGHGWNTTHLANGPHVLAVHVTGGGLSAWQRLPVTIANRDFELTTSKLRPWEKVKGVVRIRANVRGARTTGIGLYVDGKVISRDRTAPFTLRWNSARVHDGRHRITLAAVSLDGRIVKRKLPLVVVNHPRAKRKPVQPGPKPKPKPKPLPAVRVVSQSLADGSTVGGIVTWGAHTIGPVWHVAFVVDGTVLSTSTTEPWTATWDTSTVAPGPHQLAVRALTRDGHTGATAAVTVSVSPPPPPAPSP